MCVTEGCKGDQPGQDRREGPIQIGITVGDPGGIGAEVVLKALSTIDVPNGRFTVFGQSRLLALEEELLVETCGGYRPVLEGRDDSGKIRLEIVEVGEQRQWDERPTGPTGAWGARLQRQALQRAMEAVDEDSIDAIVTAPWNKALFSAIDHPVVGHTEVLADYFDAREVVMMLAGPRLRVSLVTTHVGIGDVAEAVTAQALEKTLRVTARGLRRRYGVHRPRLAVCGLNPHAGEGGHMGSEEIDVISPVVEGIGKHWKSKGIEIEGPFPADTLFAKFRDATPFDAVVCMYHDQGLIPLKLLHFGQSANVTLGLPVVRTSVDHGTAYDIAGRGVADGGSMRYALETAAKMVRRQEE